MYISLHVALPPMILNSAVQQTSTPGFTVTLSLPTALSYSPSELVIISTLTPNDTAPITDDYPSSSQYSVSFPSLRVGVAYSYYIRIVLRGNSSIDVFIPFQGSFTLSKHNIVLLVSKCFVLISIVSFVYSTLHPLEQMLE